MKTLNKLLLLLAITAFNVPSLHAQNINREEIRQDINILEGVLEEMFETEWELEEMFETEWEMPENTVHVYSGSISFSGWDDKINGTYLPEYGAIFTIPNRSTGYINYYSDDGESTGFNRFADGEKVTKESIITRIVEFLAEYGITIDQLSPEDKIMVIYESNYPENMLVVTVSPPADEDLKPRSIPTITVIAEYSDIRAFQNDEIGRNEFRDQLKISTTSEGEETQTDLKIMANILETAFEESENERFEINGDIDYLKIDNFGALFSFEISYGDLLSGIRVFGEELDGTRIFGDVISDSLISLTESFSKVKWDSLFNAFSKIKWDSLFNVMSLSLQKMGEALSVIKLDSLADSSSVSIKKDFDVKILDSLSVSIKKELTEIKEEMPQEPHVSTGIKVAYSEEALKAMKESQKQLAENAEKALQQFLSQLKEYIIDYGPTLDSIPPNGQLLFSIEVNSGFDELPERLVVQVEKSVLGAAERGEISRDEAMEEIAVRMIQ